MNFGKAFTYIFDDPDWFDKLLIPVLVGLIPVVGTFALMGYVLRTVANVARNVEYPLPRFDFGEDLGRGFRYFLVQLVWMIPVFLLTLLIFVPLMAVQNYDNGAGNWILIVLLTVFIIVVSVILGFFQPLVMANLAVKDKFSAGFEFGDFFRRLKNNFGAWMMVILGAIIAGVIIAPLGAFIILIGVIITSTYAQLITAHLTGQAYRVSENQN